MSMRPRDIAHAFSASWCARRLAIAFFAMVTSLLSLPSNAQISEYDVKAAFLFNFALFTQAIPSAPSGNSTVAPVDAATTASPASYRICIYGKDPFGPALKSLSSRKVAGRPVAIVQGVNLDELKTCQLIFIGETDRDSVRRAANAVIGLPIITVAEVKEFPFTSVIFNLILVDEKVAFKINTVAAKNQQLDVSAKLIRLAKSVH